MFKSVRRKNNWSTGILLAGLVAGAVCLAPSVQAQPTAITYTAPGSAVSQSAISSTNGNPLLYVPSNPYNVGDVIYFTGTTSASNPFGTSAARYYVIYSSGNNIKVATTFAGAALNATYSITAAATAQQYPDWLNGAYWSGGSAPNSSSSFASLPGAGGGSTPPGGLCINGNVTIYGLGWNNASQDLYLFSGSSNDTSLYPLTMATSDSTIPKITATNATGGVIFFGSANQGQALKINGTQGLIFNAGPGGAITGSGVTATASAPAKNYRIYANVDWSGFSGGFTVERGEVQQQNGASVFSTNQSLTMGDAQTTANNLLAGFDMNGRDTTFDAVNGTTLGRIYNNSATQGILYMGNAGGSGTYAGDVGRNYVGSSTGPIYLTKVGTGTQTISGIVGTNAGSSVTVNAGTLILSGANNYGGATTVNAGKLVLSSAQLTTNTVTVANAADLGIVVSGSSQFQPGTLTLGSSAATTLEFNGITSTTTAPLKPATVSLGGTVTVNINSGTFSAGNSYPLMTWTTRSGTGGFALGSSPLTANLTTNSTTLFLNVTAVTDTWVGSTNGNWDTATTNWSVGGSPGAFSNGSTALFNDTAPGATNITVSQLVQPGGIVFQNSNLTYSVTSSTGNYIGGAGSLTVNGGGLVTLTGPNTYSGGTVLSAGQLDINYGGSNATNSAIGTGTFSISSGSIDNTSGSNVSLAPAIPQSWNGNFSYIGSTNSLNLGTGVVTLGTNCVVSVTNNTLTSGGAIGDGGAGYALTKAGSGTLVLGGANTYSGGTTLSAGTIQAGSATALGSGASQLGAGILDLNGNTLVNSNNINSAAFVLTNSSATAGAITGNSHVSQSFTVGVGAGNIAIGRLIDTGSALTVTKVGTGTVTFNGAGYNNLMGVTVNAGTAVFANTSGTTADRGVTLNAGTIVLNAVGTGSGLNAQLINTTQPFTVNGGTFNLNGWNETVSTIGGTGGVILNNAPGTNSTLTVGPDNGSTTYSATYAGSIQNGTGVLALVKVGSGTQTLTGTNTYTGGTTVTNSGTLQAGTNNVFSTAGGDMNVASGTLDLNTFNNGINGLNGAGTVDTVAGGSPTLTVGVNGDSGNFSGTLQNTAGTLSLTKVGSGTQTLSGVNNYSGSTTITNGTLTVASSLNGSGAVNVSGPGVLNPTNSPSITGAVTLLNSGATLSLLDNAIDTVALNGGLALSNGSVLKFDVSSAGADEINVSGTFSATGTTTVNINQVNAPNAGTYTLISGASGISASQFTLGNSLSGYSLTLTSDASDLYLVVALSAPATAYWDNHAGTVWNGHSGSTYNWDTDQSSDVNAGTVPAASSDVYFAANTATSFTTTLGTNFVLKSLNFNVASAVTIAGTNSLTLNGALSVNSGAGTNTIGVGSLILGADQNLNVADTANTLTISSPISGAHALNVNAASGAGTLVLSGSSSFTGGTTITGGTLSLANPTNTLPDSGAVTVNGGNLNLATNSDTVGAVTLVSGSITGTSGVLTGSSYSVQNGTVSAALGGTGALSMTGSSVLLSGNSTYSGGTTLSTGTLQLGSSNALGSGSVTIAAGTTLDLNGQTIPNAITYSGAGTLYNTGPGSATLTANGNLNNALTIDTTGGNITVARLIGAVTHIVTAQGGNTLTFDGAGHNNLLSLVVNGPTVELANNGGYSIDRGLTLDYGTVQLAGPGNGGSYPNANLINPAVQFWVLGGTFDLNGWNETVATVVGTSGVIENNAAGTNSTLSVGGDNGTNSYSGTMQDGAGTLGITKVGTGIQTLSGVSTYSGNTTVSSGQLVISASATSPNSTYVVNTNGGLQFLSDTAYQFGGLSGSGSLSLLNQSSSPVSLTVGGNNLSTTYAGVLSDGGAGATLVKVGTNTLTLSGANTYTGLTTVSNGTLVIAPVYVSGGNFTVNEGAIFGVSGNTATTSGQVGTLNLGITGSGSSTILFTSLPVPTNAPLTVSSLSPVGGAGSVIISNTAVLSVGTYNLINYTNITGVGYNAFSLGGLTPGTVAHLTNNTTVTPKVIQLVVTAIAPQIWSGAVSTNWDISTTANWKLNGVASDYADLSPALFDDTVGSGPTTVNLATNVQPSLLTISNNAKNYTLTTANGSGIYGATSLTKNGTGTLTLVNLTNSFAGGSTLNSGTVVLSASTLGSGTITDNATLVFSNGTAVVSNTIAGSGALAQNGAGSLVLAGVNTYSGATTIKNGTVQSGNPSALGTGSVVLGDGTSANNATLQASPTTSFTNANPITVAAGGSGVYVIQNISSGDYNLSGNLALSNALTLATTANGALFIRGVITSSGANPFLTISGGGTTSKFVGLYANNAASFTGDCVVTNSGDLKSGNTNSLSVANTVALDSTATFDNGSLSLTIAGLNDFGSVGGNVADAGTGIYLTLGGSGSYSFSGVINNVGGLIKTGTGQQTLAGVNTYSGATVVSNGTLVVNGSLAGGAVTVAGGTLAGNGTLHGATTVSGGMLSPGVSGIGTLVISNTLTVQAGGTLGMDINKTAGTHDLVSGLTSVTYGGTLAVNNLAGTLTTSDSFKLFSAGSYAGTFATITPATPATGLVWNTNTLASDGTLRIASGVATNPTNLTFSVSGNILSLSWPADHLGWRLLVQTNNLSAGVSQNTNDWGTVSGSTSIDSTNITVDPAKPAEFYRLVNP